MMDQTQIAKQMIGFQKTIFDNSFNAMAVVQDQTETMITNVMSQLPWMTDDGKKQMADTFTFTKKARDDFKKAVDEGYAQFDKFFDNK